MNSLITVAVCTATAFPSFAQDEPIEAPLTAATSNPAGCTALDPALSRVVTKMGDPATIKRNAVAP